MDFVNDVINDSAEEVENEDLPIAAELELEPIAAVSTSQENCRLPSIYSSQDSVLSSTSSQYLSTPDSTTGVVCMYENIDIGQFESENEDLIHSEGSVLPPFSNISTSSHGSFSLYSRFNNLEINERNSVSSYDNNVSIAVTNETLPVIDGASNITTNINNDVKKQVTPPATKTDNMLNSSSRVKYDFNNPANGTIKIKKEREEPKNEHYFTCNNCEDIFTSKRKLRRHSDFRCPFLNQISKFQCTSCDKLYLHESHLQKHVLSVHKLVISIDEALEYPKVQRDVSDNTCNFCGKHFSHSYHLRRHIDFNCPEILQKEKNICTMCGETLSGITNLQKHVLHVHDLHITHKEATDYPRTISSGKSDSSVKKKNYRPRKSTLQNNSVDKSNESFLKTEEISADEICKSEDSVELPETVDLHTI